MPLTGMLLDVSRSMRESIGSGTDEEGGAWAQSIFKVIDDLIKYDVSDEHRVFAIGVGANCATSIFDVLGTLQQIRNMEIPNFRKNEPATINNVNQILDILNKNVACHIRQWIKDISLIQETVSDYIATLFLTKLQQDSKFLWKFVNEFLPSVCREMVSRRTTEVGSRGGDKSLVPFTGTGSKGGLVSSVVEDQAVGGMSHLRPATRADIQKVVKKARCYFLREVQTHSIFSVQEAYRIIRECVNEKELSTERKQELLENVEPFIYGNAPLFESLKNATQLFETDASKNKLLFVLSDGDPTDGSYKDRDKIKHITSKLTNAGVKIICCFITKSTDIDPKHLFDEMHTGWKPGAKLLFSLSSKVPTQHLPRTILVKRGWTIDVANNETKLFMQVNHPDNLREACEMAKDAVYSFDALSELLTSVDLDMYINQSKDDFEAKKQVGETCYANASAAVLHLAMQRILGREGKHDRDFYTLRNEMIQAYGKDGADTSDVLRKFCKDNDLRSGKVSTKEAMEAVVKKRSVVARFQLTRDEWKAFSKFYKKDPTGILTQDELDVRKRPKNPSPDTEGHAVVLTSYNSKCLIFMNSWGQEWGDNGFFRVQNAEVLQLEFFDVYWELDDLSEGEKEYYRKHGSEVATKLMNSLKGLQNAEYMCPKCQQTSLVTEFEGTQSEVKCPKCSRKFSTSYKTGNILALNLYLLSLSR